MKHRSIGLLAALAVALSFVAVQSGALAEELLGRCKVYRVGNKPPLEGIVTLDGDTYIVELKPGQVQRIPKTQVTKIEKLEAAPDTAAAKPAGGAETAKTPITDAMIEKILGSENLDVSSLDIEDVEVVDLLSDLPREVPSEQEMLRLAGAKGKLLHTAHFVFCYTSDVDQARKLAARLESVYAWNVRYCEMLKIPTRRPKAKLEIFYFGTYEEYESYQTVNGFSSMGAIGFYHPYNNRSAFFDMLTWPPYGGLVAALKDPKVDGGVKLRIRTRLERSVEHKNVEVVQHEAGHHIHFNIGTFNWSASPPRWMSEGLATMFEVPPSEFGASFGATNHYRLFWFRRAFGEKAERLEDLRIVLYNDGWFFGYGFYAYSFGWAMNHYLYREHREKYGEWMRFLATREIEEFGPADWQKHFEELFGTVNDEWREKFINYIAGLELRMDAFPPEE